MGHPRQRQSGSMCTTREISVLTATQTEHRIKAQIRDLNRVQIRNPVIRRQIKSLTCSHRRRFTPIAHFCSALVVGQDSPFSIRTPCRGNDGNDRAARKLRLGLFRTSPQNPQPIVAHLLVVINKGHPIGALCKRGLKYRIARMRNTTTWFKKCARTPTSTLCEVINQISQRQDFIIFDKNKTKLRPLRHIQGLQRLQKIREHARSLSCRGSNSNARDRALHIFYRPRIMSNTTLQILLKQTEHLVRACDCASSVALAPPKTHKPNEFPHHLRK